MNRILVAAVLTASLTLSASSVQAVFLQANFVGSVSDSFGGGLGNLDVYTIVADNSIANGGTGTAIFAFDLTFYGTFAQVQNSAFGVNNPSPLRSDVVGFGTAALAQDTHFLPDLRFPGPPIPAPTEGVLTAGIPASGLADNLVSNQVAIAGHDQAAVVEIAQLVLTASRNPSHVWCEFSVEGVMSVSGNPYPVPVFGGLCPEPLSVVLTLLGSGCLTLRRGRI